MRFFATLFLVLALNAVAAYKWDATGLITDETIVNDLISHEVEFSFRNLVVNENGGDYDTRIEGDTEPNLFFVDASTDRIGIGTNSPGDVLDVYTQSGDTQAVRITSAANKAAIVKCYEGATVTGVHFGYQGNGNYFVVEGINAGIDQGEHLVILRDSGYVGIGTTSPVSILSNTSSAPTGLYTVSGINWMINEDGYAAAIKNTSAGASCGAMYLGVPAGAVALYASGEVYVKQKFAVGTGSTATISSGAISADSTYQTLAGEGGAADDLDTINGGEYTGQILILRNSQSVYTITIKDATGNININGDFAMDNAMDTITLIYSGSVWIELSRSDNA